MDLGLVGRKVGMTRVFTEQGASVPVTVLEMTANRVTQVKTKETDGYTAVQVTFGEKKANRVNKAEAGHFAKAGVEAGRGLHEFVVSEQKAAELKAGDLITVSLFEVGQLVDVTGTSKGKGFSGTIKRHNFGSQRTSHGNSWLVSTVIPNQLFSIWKLCALIQNAICCWLKALFLVRSTAMLWFATA